jgi:hypothetical protein
MFHSLTMRWTRIDKLLKYRFSISESGFASAFEQFRSDQKAFKIPTVLTILYRSSFQREMVSGAREITIAELESAPVVLYCLTMHQTDQRAQKRRDPETVWPLSLFHEPPIEEITRPGFSFCKYLLKTQFKHSRKGILFATICHILPEKENGCFYLRRKKMLSTENNVGPNRHDGDHVLILIIDFSALSDQI